MNIYSNIILWTTATQGKVSLGEKEYKSGSQEISIEYLFAKNRRRHCREQASHSLEVIQVICSFAPLATRPVETEEELPCQ